MLPQGMQVADGLQLWVTLFSSALKPSPHDSWSGHIKGLVLEIGICGLQETSLWAIFALELLTGLAKTCTFFPSPFFHKSD
jgi:hypothetical protein